MKILFIHTFPIQVILSIINAFAAVLKKSHINFSGEENNYSVAEMGEVVIAAN